jgi:hypothetical protein
MKNMTTRALLLGGACALVLREPPKARAQAVYPNDGNFHWRKPGGFPYQGTPQQAFQAFGDLLPPPGSPAYQELWYKVENRQYKPARVFEEWRVTRMMFGPNQQVPNVIVNTSDFAAWGSADKTLEMYRAEDDDWTYAVYLPRICGNFCIMKGKRWQCLPDVRACTAWCQQLQAWQYQS